MPWLCHRLESPTQTSADAHHQQTSGEIWGRAARGSRIPKVKAYEGPLPAGARGIEFETDVEPDSGSPPGKVFWSAGKPGVERDGDVVMIRVRIRRVGQ